MRILHLIDSDGVYGAERVLLYLASEQIRQGNTPIIGSIRRPGIATSILEEAAADAGIPVIRIRVASRPTPGVVHGMLSAARDASVDVLHSHGYKANILLGPLPHRTRGPMIATLHGWTGAETFSAKRIYEAIDKWALRRIDRVTVVARSMLAIPAVKRIHCVRLIENGIPPRNLRLEALQRGGAPKVPTVLTDFMRRFPTLMAIGRLSAEKGFDLLLDAFARTHAGDARQQLVIVGEGPQRAALEARVIALQLQDKVLLPGYLDGAERLFGDAAGFVMSSLTEGMPLVLLEAMQWRVPILATSVGAIPELLDYGRRGELVPPGSVEALTEGLRHLMTPMEAAREESVERAYVAVQRHYTSSRMADEYRRLYQEIT